MVGPSRTIGSTELLLEGDAVPTTTEGEPTGLQPLLNGFSRSVRAVVGRLDLAATTVWQLADGLLREHEDEYGAIAVPPLVQRSGEPRPLTRWLELVQGLLNQQAVADSKSQVIDGRLVLLGLARLDSGLDRVLRDTGVRWRLEEGLGYPLPDVFWPWALPWRPTEWLDLWTLRIPQPGSVNESVFSPDGSLVATACLDGTARLWDVAAGSERATLSAYGATGHHFCAFSPDGGLLATANN